METQNLRKGLEDAIYFAKMIEEIYIGKVSERGIQVEVKTDNRALCNTLRDIKQTEEKNSKGARVWIGEQLDEETVGRVTRVKSSEMTANDLINANTRKKSILSTITEAKLH